MNSAASFSSDYQTARSRFLTAAKAADAQLNTFIHPERGPDGGELACDVGWIGPSDAEAVLVLISATHGVEGFCGSGAQLDWLIREEYRGLSSGTAVLLIHAINPYGFAWLRRVTHENVDLNRNWIDFNARHPANRAYDALCDIICPQSWSGDVQADTRKALLAYANEHGFMALQQALSGGQYAHPRGIFFGGDEPTWSRRIQTQIFQDALLKARRIAIIDYHTGLGPWGLGEQIVLGGAGSPSHTRASRWYGGAITSPSGGDSTSADIAGDGLSFAPTLLAHAEVTAMALEFGTKPVLEILDALRADAWLHAFGEPASPQGQMIKAQVKDAFYGDADDWKGMIAGQSLLAVRQALKGLRAH